MIKVMITMAAKKLKTYLLENKGVFTISEEAVNQWMKENDHPIRLKFDMATKEFTIKLIKADSNNRFAN